MTATATRNQVAGGLGEPRFITRKDAAARCSVSLDTVDALVATGAVRAKKYGRKTLVDRASLDSYFDGLEDA